MPLDRGEINYSQLENVTAYKYKEYYETIAFNDWKFDS